MDQISRFYVKLLTDNLYKRWRKYNLLCGGDNRKTKHAGKHKITNSRTGRSERHTSTLERNLWYDGGQSSWFSRVPGYNIYMTKTVVVGDGDAVTVTRV